MDGGEEDWWWDGGVGSSSHTAVRLCLTASVSPTVWERRFRIGIGPGHHQSSIPAGWEEGKEREKSSFPLSLVWKCSGTKGSDFGQSSQVLPLDPFRRGSVIHCIMNASFQDGRIQRLLLFSERRNDGRENGGGGFQGRAFPPLSRTDHSSPYFLGIAGAENPSSDESVRPSPGASSVFSEGFIIHLSIAVVVQRPSRHPIIHQVHPEIDAVRRAQPCPPLPSLQMSDPTTSEEEDTKIPSDSPPTKIPVFLGSPYEECVSF